MAGKSMGLALLLSTMITQNVIACETPWTDRVAIEETNTLACDRSWMDLQRRIKTARGFTGPGDFENSEIVIEAERMLAALNTLDGAATDPKVDAITVIGSTLVKEQSLRNVVRAALLHVAFGKGGMANYCEHLVRRASSPNTRSVVEPPEIAQISGALRCGTK